MFTLVERTAHTPCSNRKNAFTLAEVLITLGIIGIIAAITLPSLIANYQKKVYTNQLKACISIIQNGVKKYMADEGIDDLSNSDLYTNSAEFKKFFYNYFKVVHDCEGHYYLEGKYDCFAPKYKNYKNAGYIDFTSYTHLSCQLVLNLANGMSICADPLNPTSGDSISFEIDINGLKGPNAIARDYFAFQIKNNGLLYDPIWETNGTILSSDIHAQNGSWTGALGKIINDGWKMNY